MLDPICLKCDAKWQSEMLERKRQYSCPMCTEPGLRVMKNGEATDKAWPTTDARKGKEVL